MEWGPATAEVYLRRAFAQMLQVADRMGDDTVNRRPFGPTTNPVAGLIVHCCGVADFWLGHVALGRPSDRDRDEELSRLATVAELHVLVDATVAQAIPDVGRLESGEGQDAGGRQFLPDGDGSDAAVVLNVLTELYQHLGHMEITADALGVA